jgi:hypothetical protein
MKPDSTPTTAPTPSGAPPVPTGSEDLGPIPEEILDEWRWIMQGREEGLFDQYAGEHIAIYRQKVWGSSTDPVLLREYLALKYHLDPERLVIAYIDQY